MIVGLFAPIFLAIQFFVAKKNHVTVLGWICTSVSIAVFAAPLSAVIHVVRTGRVESMPIALIGCLIVSAGAWLIYGFLLKNIYIYLPNVIGLALGAIQLSVYGHYSRTGRRQSDIEVVEDVEEIAPESDVEVELVEQHGRLVEVAGGASALATAAVDDDAATAPVDDDAATAAVDGEAAAAPVDDDAATVEDVIVEKVIVEENVNDLSNPVVAAKERMKRRNHITAELLSEEHGVISNNISAAEVKYQANENFVEDGIHIEPFNLDKEREEGYFDASGNFVEYVRDDEIKDAWLDNVEIDPRFAGLSTAATKDEEEAQELSSKDVAIMKRRIANVLEPEETVLQCLRRLKGSGDRKTKMSGETKIVFDQLTEDAMKLMENGEYDVYHEKKDVFEREAEGYEELARARGEGTSSPLAGADDFDMFADDDSAAKPSTNENNAVSEPSSDAINSGTEGGALQSDYVYDESSGYYYSSSLGYYYDPNTGLYCSAESGKWYSYNEEAGTYDEVPEVSTNSS
ncbi:uncharacterized protein LOC123904576 [Trifolium pratense]|uniref:uncharacterized protein LOC123904576 n=1 Tax=Trifolium pratense TaxID=57577 RepID=UPI001E6916E6|nr:uncharacterized protein LOC123904576 [Trifolium pratense]